MSKHGAYLFLEVTTRTLDSPTAGPEQSFAKGAQGIGNGNTRWACTGRSLGSTSDITSNLYSHHSSAFIPARRNFKTTLKKVIAHPQAPARCLRHGGMQYTGVPPAAAYPSGLRAGPLMYTVHAPSTLTLCDASHCSQDHSRRDSSDRTTLREP
jgi:hypothetical protein